jgi:hypothetical protein
VPAPGAAMNRFKPFYETDFERLSRLKIFSWLNPAQVKALSAWLVMSNYARGEVIFDESAAANKARVLVTGVARINCLNARKERVTVALIGPGPIPELPSAPLSRFDFRCEAYSRCRVGTMSWKGFDDVLSNGREAISSKFHQNDLKYWYRLLQRTSGCSISTSTNALRSQCSIYVKISASKIRGAHC